MTRSIFTLLALAAFGCGDAGPPPASPTDMGPESAQCIAAGGRFFIPCPGDHPGLCWSGEGRMPVCPDVRLDASTEPLDAGPDPLDARDAPDSAADSDGGDTPPDAFEPELDAGDPATLDPRLETWTSPVSCEVPGVLLTGGDLCAFGTGDTTGGARISPVNTGSYGVPRGEACTPNAMPEGSKGDCRAPGICFDSACSSVCPLDGSSTICTSQGLTCLDVGHETHGVCGSDS